MATVIPFRPLDSAHDAYLRAVRAFQRERTRENGIAMREAWERVEDESLQGKNSTSRQINPADASRFAISAAVK